jgi:hypothetical protein
MAKKKKVPARKAAPKAAGRARTATKKVARRATAARKSAKTAMKSAARTMKKAVKPAKKAARSAKKAAGKLMKAASKKTRAVVRKAKTPLKSMAKPASSAMGKAANLAKAVKAGVTAALTPSRAATKARPKHPPSLDRERKTVQEIHGAPSTLGSNPSASAAKTGRDELRQKLGRHTSSSPALTAGDVDADWESADSTGDEAPGGDNPTPDQDVVDEIGRALGVEYEDDEELQGGDEIADRDRHRWELDPNSAEDTDDRD